MASKIIHSPFLDLATQSSTRFANPGIDPCPSQNIAGLGIFFIIIKQHLELESQMCLIMPSSCGFLKNYTWF